MRTRSLNHSTYQHQYHVVWGTRARRKFLKPYVHEYFLMELKKVIAKYPTIYLISVNTNEDHVHLQIEIPPNIEVSTAIQRLKSETSKKIRKKFKFIDRMYLEKGIWSVGYFSSTVGLNEEQIKKYIEYQQKRDQGGQLTL